MGLVVRKGVRRQWVWEVSIRARKINERYHLRRVLCWHSNKHSTTSTGVRDKCRCAASTGRCSVTSTRQVQGFEPPVLTYRPPGSNPCAGPGCILWVRAFGQRRFPHLIKYPCIMQTTRHTFERFVRLPRLPRQPRLFISALEAAARLAILELESLLDITSCSERNILARPLAQHNDPITAQSTSLILHHTTIKRTQARARYSPAETGKELRTLEAFATGVVHIE